MNQSQNMSEIAASTVSKGFRRLRKAIEVAQQQDKAKFTESYINKLMSDVSNSYDLRATIFCVFFRVGFDLHELTPEEKQRMEVIQLYPYLKNGEVWLDIKQELDDKQVKLTQDDDHWLHTCIEESAEQVENAIYNQNLYASEIEGKLQGELDRDYSAIRLKNKAKFAGSSMMSQQSSMVA